MLLWLVRAAEAVALLCAVYLMTQECFLAAGVLMVVVTPVAFYMAYLRKGI